MKRETYKGFEIYPEVFHVKGLTQDELLVFGMVYNFTGKNTKPFKRGLNTNGITKAMKSNAHLFNLSKKLTRTVWMSQVDNLTNKEWLYISGTEERPSSYGELSIRNYQITDFGMEMINQAKQDMNNKFNTKATPLF